MQIITDILCFQHFPPYIKTNLLILDVIYLCFLCNKLSVPILHDDSVAGNFTEYWFMISWFIVQSYSGVAKTFLR